MNNKLNILLLISFIVFNLNSKITKKSIPHSSQGKFLENIKNLSNDDLRVKDIRENLNISINKEIENKILELSCDNENLKEKDLKENYSLYIILMKENNIILNKDIFENFYKDARESFKKEIKRNIENVTTLRIKNDICKNKRKDYIFNVLKNKINLIKNEIAIISIDIENKFGNKPFVNELVNVLRECESEFIKTLDSEINEDLFFNNFLECSNFSASNS